MNWYDYPEYYDIAFGWDATGELDFLGRVFGEYASPPVRSVFEPFCGTGRLTIPLATRGYRVAGLDLNARAIEYAQRRCAATNVAVGLDVADVCNWSPQAGSFDAVVTLIDSFRHLATEEAAGRAIRAFRRGLRDGGVLVVGLCLGDARDADENKAEWTMERDGVRVETRVTQLGLAGAQAGTWLIRHAMRVHERDGRALDIVTDEPMRAWTLESLVGAMREHGPFSPAAVFDWKDLSQPLPADTPSSAVNGNHVVVFTAA